MAIMSPCAEEIIAAEWISFMTILSKHCQQGANSHFLRTAGPHFPDSPGHIKRTAWDISRAEGSPPY